MDTDFWIFVAIIVAVLGCLVGGAFVFDRQACFSKTSGMGFEVRYSIMGGCQIEVRENQWIPLESYYFKEE